jgi:hypothetical protein
MKLEILAAALLGLAFVAGCGETKPEDSAAAVDGSQYIIREEPDGAKDVIAVRDSAQDGDDVLLEGRIGGAHNPWVDGYAAFTVVDSSLRACSDIPGDGCKTPWDYCCETPKLKTATALVKVVDEDGNAVAADARKLLNVTELSRVVVKGKAQRDEAGNLTVLASGIHVKK